MGAYAQCIYEGGGRDSVIAIQPTRCSSSMCDIAC